MRNKQMKVTIDNVNYMLEVIIKFPTEAEAALNIRFDSDAGDNITVRDYLFKILMMVWDEGEGFDGKRPFGNSGWDYELYRVLVMNGFTPGKIDNDGCIKSIDKCVAHEYVSGLIRYMCYGGK